jgi:molybdate transport system substrate-binding protein
VVRKAGSLLVACVFVAACGTGADIVTVSAASSLAEAFGEIERAFEAANPGVDVVLNLGGSSSLAAQIEAGAAVDVFATADGAHLAGIASGRPFAGNDIVVATPPDNPGGMVGLEDFADPDLYLGLCAVGVPCGDLARRALRSAGVIADIDTEEPDVRSLVTKLLAGELDGGVVYRTDLEGLFGIEIPLEHRASATYEIASLTGAGDEFVDFVLSDAGRSILLDHGFGTP